MKKALTDVKSFVTVCFTLSLVALLLIVTFTKSDDVFNTVFLLFTNLSTAAFTYFFTRHDKNVKEDDTKKNNTTPDL